MILYLSLNIKLYIIAINFIFYYYKSNFLYNSSIFVLRVGIILIKTSNKVINKFLSTFFKKFISSNSQFKNSKLLSHKIFILSNHKFEYKNITIGDFETSKTILSCFNQLKIILSIDRFHLFIS